MQRLALQPDEYLVAEKDKDGMLLSFQVTADGRITDVVYTTKDTVPGARLMKKVGEDTRRMAPANADR